MSEFAALDPERIRSCSISAARCTLARGGDFEVDPFPGFHELRESGPCTRASSARSSGVKGILLPRPAVSDRPHFSAFDFATCDAAFRDGDTYASSRRRTTPPRVTDASMLYMNGAATAVTGRWCSRRSCRTSAKWWMEHWIDADRARADRQLRGRQAGRAQHRLLRRHPDADDHQQLRPHHRGGADMRAARSRPTAWPRRRSRLPHADHPGAAGGAQRRPRQRAVRRRRSPTRTARRPVSATTRSWRSRSCCSRPARAPRGSRWASR